MSSYVSNNLYIAVKCYIFLKGKLLQRNFYNFFLKYVICDEKIFEF